MGKLIIGTHMRLQEWVADEKGYFAAEGLDYELVPGSHASSLSIQSAGDLPKELIRGAYQTIEDGRSCGVSSACHWTVNMAAAAGHGRLWADAYSVTPAGIYVAADSAIRSAEELADVPITVGYQSGSHYSAIQALENVLPRERIRLHFGGMLFQRLELLLGGKVAVAVLFNAPMYLAEQLGFRKLADCTFISAVTVREGVHEEDVGRCYRALARAQADIDLCHQRYTHYYRQEFPQRLGERMDTRMFGPGERIVSSRYTREMYEETQRWIESWNIFEDARPGRRGYEDSTLAAAREA